MSTSDRFMLEYAVYATEYINGRRLSSKINHLISYSKNKLNNCSFVLIDCAFQVVILSYKKSYNLAHYLMLKTSYNDTYTLGVSRNYIRKK